MSMIGFKICLASESSGVVTLAGAPVEGATVKRYVKSDNNGKEFTHETTTDKDGRFSFPSVYMRSLLPLLMMIQPVTQQEVTVKHNGQEYLAWSLTKMNWELDREVNNHQDIKNGNTKPFKVACDLSHPEKGNLIDSNSQGFYGRCSIENVAFEKQ
ncbi:MAG: carboxypeptidase-like regulatory domain-containing protein [Agarilytica sp.]